MAEKIKFKIDTEKFPDLLSKIEDLTKIDDAMSIINKIQGFRFKWKEGGEDSMGVSAQEVEQVLPELVSNDEFKSVNYNGIIAVLIEAVKELSKEIRTNG